jgi:hypothetical protein
MMATGLNDSFPARPDESWMKRTRRPARGSARRGLVGTRIAVEEDVDTIERGLMLHREPTPLKQRWRAARCSRRR